MRYAAKLVAALLAVGMLWAPVASAQRGFEPMPRMERPPRIEPLPEMEPRLPERPEAQIPPPPQVLCSNEDALAGRCVVVARLPRCPGDPRCPRPSSNQETGTGETNPQP